MIIADVIHVLLLHNTVIMSFPHSIILLFILSGFLEGGGGVTPYNRLYRRLCPKGILFQAGGI